MKLQQLIKSYSWLSVEIIFKNLYPDDESIEAHKRVFETLQTLEPLESTISILIKNVKDDYDGSSFIDVSGFDNSFIREKEFDTPYTGLELTEWENWLGMEIEKETLLNFSELEIICHSLYEMTFMGYSQEEIKEQRNSINGKIEQIKNMTEEERKNNFKSLDDLLKEINDEEE